MDSPIKGLCGKMTSYFFYKPFIIDSLPSLNPHAKTFGGMGNLFIGAIGIQFFALTIDRIAIFNNALITDLFNHPDPRQSWTPIPTTVVNGEMKQKVANVAADQLSLPIRHFDSVKFKYIGTHGVPTMNTGFQHFAEQNLMAVYYPTDKPPLDKGFYRNIVCQVRSYLNMAHTVPTMM